MEIYDPKVEPEQIINDLTHPSVTDNPEYVRQAVKIQPNPYSAVIGTHAIVVCTEWDEFEVGLFTVYLFRRIYFVHHFILFTFFLKIFSFVKNMDVSLLFW